MKKGARIFIIIMSFIFLMNLMIKLIFGDNPKSNENLFNELQDIKKDVQCLKKFINENKTQIQGETDYS